ncbi:MAG: hypothetical protein RL375_3699 [Pseudomonadota bacterium]
MHVSTDSKGPCWKCTRFGGWIRQATGKPIYIWCVKAHQVQARPEHGCAHWELQDPPRTAPLAIDLPGPSAG